MAGLWCARHLADSEEKTRQGGGFSAEKRSEVSGGEVFFHLLGGHHAAGGPHQVSGRARVACRAPARLATRVGGDAPGPGMPARAEGSSRICSSRASSPSRSYISRSLRVQKPSISRPWHGRRSRRTPHRQAVGGGEVVDARSCTATASQSGMDPEQHAGEWVARRRSSGRGPRTRVCQRHSCLGRRPRHRAGRRTAGRSASTLMPIWSNCAFTRSLATA